MNHEEPGILGGRPGCDDVAGVLYPRAVRAVSDRSEPARLAGGRGVQGLHEAGGKLELVASGARA